MREQSVLGLSVCGVANPMSKAKGNKRRTFCGSLSPVQTQIFVVLHVLILGMKDNLAGEAPTLSPPASPALFGKRANTGNLKIQE